MQLPTVKIKYPANKRAGFAIINESDFDPKRHDLFDAPARKPKAPEGQGGEGEAQKSELGELRKVYKAAYGKGPSPKWDAATLREKIAAKRSEADQGAGND